MVKKILPNRISKLPPPEVKTKIRQVIQLLDEILGDNTPISDDDYKSLRKIADKLKQECDDVFAIAIENPEFLDESNSIVEMEKDKRYYELCDTIRSMLNGMLIKLDKEQNIAGAEYFNACSIFEDNVKIKAGRGNAKAQNVKAQLDLINRNRSNGSSGGSNDNKNDNPPAK